MNIAEKWSWVCEHKAFEPLGANITVSPQMVDPITKDRLDDESKNTELNWWLELSYFMELEDEDGEPVLDSCHDTDLDCGGVTMEEAVNVLYDLVKAKYGE